MFCLSHLPGLGAATMRLYHAPPVVFGKWQQLPSLNQMARLPSHIRMAVWSQREDRGVQRSAFIIREFAGLVAGAFDG